MIRDSFVLLEKISATKEQQLWAQGIKQWPDFLRAKKIKGISAAKKHYYDRQLWEAMKKLQEDDSSYFVGKLPGRETWRLYPHFRDECGFLDVVVDSQGNISVVGISNYYRSVSFVKGFNLEKNELEKEIQKYKIIVSFNGKTFDFPKLQKGLGVVITIPHIDLKPLCAQLGLVGGLKEVEKLLNLKRPDHLHGNPVELWKAFHASGDKEYLELLLEYNREDIENLKGVMDFVYKELTNRIQKLPVHNLQ